MREPLQPIASRAITFGMVAVAAQLSLVWAFSYFPSVDGPAHVHLAYGFYEALRGDPYYGGIFELNEQFNPNLTTQAMLVVLQAVAPPFIAEKIWLSIYFVSFAFAAAYTLNGINRNAACLLPLLIFCSFNFPLAFGFYNFAFSTVVFLGWFGFWWRHRHSGSWKVIAGHALFAALAYLTHVFAFVVSLLGIGLAASTSALIALAPLTRAEGSLALRLRIPLTHTLPPLIGSLPALGACLYFLFGRFAVKTAAGAENLAAPEASRILDLVWANSFATYDAMETGAAISFVALVAIILARALLQCIDWKGGLPIFAVFAGFLVLYLAMPPQWIVRWMPQRFQPLVFVAILIWIATLLPHRMGKRSWEFIALAGLVPVLLSTAIRFNVFSRINDYYGEIAQVQPHIAPQSSLVALRLHHSYLGETYPARLDVFIQAGSRIASLRHSVDLKNFQGQSNDHPIQFRSGVSATAALGGDSSLTAFPPRIQLMEYERRTGRRIDYVVTYGARGEVDNVSALRRLDEQLAGNYKLVYTSQPRGLVRLYARDLTGTPPG